MRKAVLCLFLVMFLVASTSCIHKANLDRIEDVEGLNAEEASVDIANLESRVNDLFSILLTDKITTYNTKAKLRPYFQTEKDLVEFIAMYAAEFRDLHIKKERLTKVSILDTKIQQNGVIALVRINLKGRLYVFLPSILKEVQEWRKVGGTWYMIPTPHKAS